MHMIVHISNGTEMGGIEGNGKISRELSYNPMPMSNCSWGGWMLTKTTTMLNDTTEGQGRGDQREGEGRERDKMRERET